MSKVAVEPTDLETPEEPVEGQQALSPMQLLLKFLETPGHVLLIQGAPGTGKTTLAFEILSQMNGTHKVYTSSRVSPAKLRQHFPWLDEVLDSMSGRAARASWIEELHDIRGSDAENVFNKVLRLKHSKQRAVLVIDSWEGALRNTNSEGRRMLESAVLSELDQSRVSVVLVTEGREAGDLGFLVDGIVTLSQSELDGKMVRVLTLNKMRGFGIHAPNAPFTLGGGRFTFLPRSIHSGSSLGADLLVPVPHSEDKYSTGSKDLDSLLGGGMNKGSFLLIDIDSNAPSYMMRVLLNMIRANFVNQGGACFNVATGTFSSENVAEQLRPYVGDKAMDERVRISEYNATLPQRKWRVKLTGKLVDDVATFYSIWEGFGKASSGRMLNVDFDKVVQVYGEDLTLPGFTEIGEQMRDTGGLYIGVASRNTKVREEFLRTADYQLKIQSFNGSLLIYGVKPFTPIYGATFSFEKGYPELTLLEMV